MSTHRGRLEVTGQRPKRRERPRTSEPLVLTRLFVRHPCPYEGVLDGRRIPSLLLGCFRDRTMPSHRALAVRMRTRNAWLTAMREFLSWLEKHIPNQAMQWRAMEF